MHKEKPIQILPTLTSSGFQSANRCWLDVAATGPDMKKTIFHYGTMGSTALRTLLEGHYHDIAFMSGIWCLCELHRNIHTIMTTAGTWPKFIKGSWPKRVHDFLCELGWQPQITTTWCYTHRQCGQINIANNRHVETILQIKHKVRESWRFKLFQTFLKQDRRDARELQANNWNYDEQQCTLAGKHTVKSTEMEKL